MSLFETITSFFRRINIVGSDDADELRRGRVLNIMIFWTVGVVFIGLLFGLISQLSNINAEENFFIFPTSIVMFMAMLIIYTINRRSGPAVASIAFLLSFILVLFFDNLDQVISGRTLFMFALPVVMSGAILPPQYSFLVAIFVGALINAAAYWNNLPLNFIALLAFILFAFVSWLSNNTLEQALKNVSKVNKNLDSLVDARTAELLLANDKLEQQAEALRFARDKAQDASRFKTELLAKVSHELRTPLGVILGTAEMLNAGLYGAVTPQQQTAVAKIIDRDQHLTQLVSDLLDESQHETQTFKLHEKLFSPRDTLAGLESAFLPKSRSKNITLQTEVDTNLPDLIWGDSGRIEQIITNLASNAIKFTHTGHVHISLERTQPDEWQIQIADTGIGIAEEAQRYVFEAFRQVDGSTTRDYDGFGLGLAIVKQLTEAMNGKINLVSEIGKGSTFTVRLPLKLDHSDTATKIE